MNKRIEFALKLIKFGKIASAEEILMKVINLSSNDADKSEALTILLDWELNLVCKNWTRIDELINMAYQINGFDDARISNILDIKKEILEKPVFQPFQDRLNIFLDDFHKNFLKENRERSSKLINSDNFFISKLDFMIKNKSKYIDKWENIVNSENKLIYDFQFSNNIEINLWDFFLKEISPIIIQRVEGKLMYFLDDIINDINFIMTNNYLGNISEFYNQLEIVYSNGYIPYGYQDNQIIIFPSW